MAAILTLLLLFSNGSNGRTSLVAVQSRRRKYCNLFWMFQSLFYVKNRSTEPSKVVMLSYNAYSFGPSVMTVLSSFIRILYCFRHFVNDYSTSQGLWSPETLRFG
uniref:Putative secreted protein n=1 Tax=Anopheles marajoara TaxID=58244 RepID=A0A2M4C8E6_9DIPT